MAIVKISAEPAYADLLLPMQERIHDYVIAGKGTAQQALDGLVKDWTEVLQDEGNLRDNTKAGLHLIRALQPVLAQICQRI